MNVRYIPLPPGARVPGFLEPPEVVAARERQKANSWFLVRNNGEAGERWPCKWQGPNGLWYGCGQTHAYLTRLCIPLPMNGLVEALMLFVSTHPNDPRAQRLMLPLHSMAQRHPETARLLASDPEAQELFAWSIGIREEIKPWRARLFIEQINALNPPEGKRPLPRG